MSSGYRVKKKLETLRLRENKNTHFPKKLNFFTLRELEKLDLAYNELDSLPENFDVWISSLEELDLSHNNLTEIKKSFVFYGGQLFWKSEYE